MESLNEKMNNHHDSRNVPKTKFEPKSYRTKKVNKYTSIVFGYFGKIKD